MAVDNPVATGQGPGQSDARTVRDLLRSATTATLATIERTSGYPFASLVESLAGNLIMPLVGAVFGQPSFDDLSVMVRGAEVPYGKFLTQLLSFILLALVLFGLVKLETAVRLRGGSLM